MNSKVSIKRRQSLRVPAELCEQLHPRIAALYADRGVASAAEIKHSLAEIHPYRPLKGIHTAVLLLTEALCKQHRILIVGDFDADGATSSALAVRFLRQLGATVDFLVPNRFQFGYGLTPEIVAVAADKRPDLLITVDNGISSVEGVAAAKARGWQVLVTDHHLPGEKLPDADAIVNPNQHEDEFPSKNLAGVGTIFYVLAALRSHLREIDWFSKNHIDCPNMAQYLDLVALGTIADVVPLDANNRILVAQGLARIRAGQCCPGILSLLSIAKRQPSEISASDLGFAVAPRLNAAGRLDDMSVGVNCLLADSKQESDALAARLDELNQTRRQIESEMKQQAMAIIDTINLDGESLPLGLCLYDDGWHEGVIGIVAARVKEVTHRPVIAFANAGQDTSSAEATIKGSARSVAGVHMRDVLDRIATQASDILQKFGGHAMAAGLTLQKRHLERFKGLFAQEVARHLCAEDCQSVIVSDGELTNTELNLDFANLLRQSGPWGQGFPEPVFDGVFTLVKRRIVAEKHLKLVLRQGSRPEEYDAIAFNITDVTWPSDVQRVQVAYQLDVNHFRGATQLQLMVRYIDPTD